MSMRVHNRLPLPFKVNFLLLSKHFLSSLPFLAEFALAWLHLRAAESKERRKEKKLKISKLHKPQILLQKTYFRTRELFLTSLLLTFFPTHFFVSQPAPKVGYRISSSSLLINDKMMIESSLT